MWHNELVGGCKGLSAKDHLGEFFSPGDITHKMVVNRAYKPCSEGQSASPVAYSRPNILTKETHSGHDI